MKNVPKKNANLVCKLIYVCTVFMISSFLVSCAKKACDGRALIVKDTHLYNGDGDLVVLRGVSYGWHNWWPRFYNASTVKYELLIDESLIGGVKVVVGNKVYDGSVKTRLRNML